MDERIDLTGHVHIVGIGGAGMSGIARILLARGAQVSGSDARESKRLVALRALGIDARAGHDARNVEGADVVLVSTAIKPDNPEVRAAQERSIPVVPRADALAAIMTGSRGVAVAGTHGKTTTTSMLTIAVQYCGADPSFAIGSELNDSGANAHQGAGDLFVVEADESDGSFLKLPAVAGIVTNVEPDHLDHWGTFEAVEQAFLDFCLGIARNDGFVVACADDPGAVRMIEQPGITLGLALLTFTGQNYGAGKYDRIKQGVRAGVVLSVLVNLPFAALEIFCPKLLASLMLNDATVISYTCIFLPVTGVALFALGGLFVFRNACQGMGKTVLPMVSGIVEVAMRVMVVLLLAPRLAFRGVAFAEISAWVGAGVMLMITYFFYQRRLSGKTPDVRG